MAAVWRPAFDRLARHPWIRWAIRRRTLLLVCLSVLAALFEVWRQGSSNDGGWFAWAGGQLLSRHGLHVYGDAELQAGPLQIAVMRLLWLACHAIHLSMNVGFSVSSTIGSTSLLVWLVRRVRAACGLPASPGTELLAGLFAIGWLMSTEVYTSGHLAELVIPASWVAAAVLLRSGRAVTAGVLLGLGAGFETWAVLGVPIAVLALTWRDVVRLGAAAGAAVAVLYGPFVIAGPFHMSSAAWSVNSHSLLHAIDPSLQAAPWSYRVVQSAVVIAAGSAAAMLARRSGVAGLGVWLVPATIGLVKAITEPAALDWYWLPAQVALLVGCACLDGLARQVQVIVAAAAVMAVAPPVQAWPISVTVTLALLASVALRPAAYPFASWNGPESAPGVAPAAVRGAVRSHDHGVGVAAGPTDRHAEIFGGNVASLITTALTPSHGMFRSGNREDV